MTASSIQLWDKWPKCLWPECLSKNDWNVSARKKKFRKEWLHFLWL